MNGTTYGDVGPAHLRSGDADQGFPGIKSYPDLDRRTVGALNFLRIALYRLLHPQPCVAAADAVILVRERCSEQRLDPVACDIDDSPLVALDGFHHSLQDRIQQFMCFLGIAIGNQLHRAFQVGEQHRDLFALAFQRALRAQARFDEVPSGGELRRSAWCAGRCQPGAALRAEIRALWALTLAALAAHPAHFRQTPSRSSE